jgi:hypothetical protein
MSFNPAITSTKPSAFKIIGDANRIPKVVPTMAPSSWIAPPTNASGTAPSRNGHTVRQRNSPARK